MLRVIFVLLLLHMVLSRNFLLKLLHTQCIHGHFVEHPKSLNHRLVGGCPRIAHLVKKARKEYSEGGTPVLYLDTGDIFTGSIWFTVYQEAITSDVMNALKPDAMGIGAHDFDLKMDRLVYYIRSLKFPIVNSNLLYNNETHLEKVVKKYLIKTIDGTKIGIVGYISPEATVRAEVGTLHIEDEVTALKKVCRFLSDEKGVNIIIALGQSGFRIDKRVAREVHEVDLIINGKSNTFLWKGKPPDREKPADVYPARIRQKSGKIVLIVAAYAHAKYLGELNVIFNSDGMLLGFTGQPIFLDRNIEQDKSVLDILSTYIKDMSERNKTIAGKSRVFLDGTRCYKRECNYGNLLVDSFVRHRAKIYRGPSWTDAPVAILNAGTIGGNINAPARGGNVSVVDILSTLQFGDTLFMFTIRGERLLRALEMSTKRTAGVTRNQCLVTSGLKIAYNFDEPYGKRVKSVKIRCGNCQVPEYRPLDKEANYTIITVRFLLKGGDGYKVLRDNSRNVKPLNVTDHKVVIDYFRETKIVMPDTGGRLTIEYGVTSGVPRHIISDIILTTVYLANGGDGHVGIRKSSFSFALEGLTDVAATVHYLQTYKEVRPECDDRITHMRVLGSDQKSIIDGTKCDLVLIAIIAFYFGNYLYI